MIKRHYGGTIVDDGFDPKNETGLVVHFEPVLFNTMFDAASREAAGEVGEIGDDLPFEVAAQFASKNFKVFRPKEGVASCVLFPFVWQVLAGPLRLDFIKLQHS